MVMSRLLRSNAPGLSSIDANDRFIRSHCAQWGARVLSRYPRLDRETLEFVIWVLDPMSGTVERVLSDNGIDIEHTMGDHSSSPDDQATAVVRLLGRAGLASQTKVARALVAELEHLIQPNCSCSMARSLDRVTETYGLSEDELTLAFFLASISAWTYAERYFDNHLECDRPTGRKYLLAALDMTHARMKAVLNGKLPRIGILDLNSSWLSLDSDFTPLFTDPSEVSSLKGLHRPLPKSDVPVQKLSIAEGDLSIIRSLLTAKGKKPIHILLYGPPGTGKTSLARGLVHDLDFDGLEVMGRDDGSLKTRRGALEACWHMSSGMKDRVLVIDEADHILGTASSWLTSGDTADKAWVNDVLERPGARSIWIVNQTDAIEPAVQRRFDFSLDVPAPDIRARREMIIRILRRNRIKRHFDESLVRQIARSYQVSPAVIANAAVTAALSAGSARECREVLRRALEAQQKLSEGRSALRTATCTPFIREGINPGLPLYVLEDQARSYDQRWRQAEPDEVLQPLNLLFHGAPGTGKSITARYLAETIDRPVLVKRGSDLLDPYVGMTERRIASAFSESQQAGAVLVIDEIDSFLYSRSTGQRNWEISLVSEFLVRLEEGRGILIGTTNRLDAIDAAARRRFVDRVAFRYLRGEQMVEMYRQVLGGLASGRLSGEWEECLMGIDQGTMAGLHAVRRRVSMRKEQGVSHRELIGELGREYSEAATTKNNIGFKS